jgi:membrane protease YdiL (CAAX protease family)
MPATVDYVFAVVVLVVTTVVEYVYFWPRFRADVAADRPGTRTRAYRRATAGQWLLTIVALAIWVGGHRPPEALGLTMPRGWPLAVAVTMVTLACALLGVQVWSVKRLSPDRRVAARPQLGGAAFMLPRTLHDYRSFLALSITAGFCEELLYRGYLPWFFAPWLGRVGAMALVVAIFGASHIYQGKSGAVRATIAGTVMAAIVLATGSLLPAMILHATIDVGGGTVGFLLLRHSPAVQMPTSGDEAMSV